MNTEQIQDGGTCARLPERVLDRRELRDLVNELAAHPEEWRDQVDFPADGGRHYASLYRDAYVDVWLLCWRPEDDTGWHDHDISSGAVHVVQGALKECNPRIGGEHLETVVPEGQSFSFGPDHIHRLTGAVEHSVSIHAYSPPLWRLGQYSIDDTGVMRRVSVSYADELRPMDSGPEPSGAVAISAAPVGSVA
ncbi:Cysteine dioxygenase type I [[Actinomadura] parvosata subsp. kistnae]|uniref:Cysteine dioxygenase n=1 Tax=[Actinomadura] parvosata subsp. kistnae TaxID=1909395 RepID=A0A1V0AGJ6_9ACTN|nr:cysteine dioxygenase family protein [Nonomuraea sp. ATCC 55076]AQZ69212.1 cysteine dioxygenase [Nonomuraea sp. ATCC 55076]SPL92179.1 Cysteine dioxygenase type I [Actinomadura parvosata subsp. kistnae]